MAEFSIDPSYLRHLIVNVRAFMGKEATDIPDDGSNPIDDPLPLPARLLEVDLAQRQAAE